MFRVWGPTVAGDRFGHVGAQRRRANSGKRLRSCGRFVREMARRMLRHDDRRGGTSKTGSATRLSDPPSGLAGHVRDRFEGTSPSHKWTTHRPSRPASLEVISIRPDAATEWPVGFTRCTRLASAPGPGTTAARQGLFFSKGHRSSDIGQHWGMSRLLSRVVDRCPLLCPAESRPSRSV